MADDVAIARARAEADAARQRLLGTAQALASALAPKRLAAVAWDNAKDKGATLAEDAVDAVKRRPVAFGGALAALTLFLAREPLLDAAKDFKARWADDNDEDDDQPAAPPPVARARRAASPRSATAKRVPVKG